MFSMQPLVTNYRHRSSDGFSLVELAVTLVLAGIIATVGLQMFDASGRSQCYTKTKAQMSDIRDAIERFAVKNDRFPMPADRTIGVDNADFGREAVVTDLTVHSGAVFGALPFQALGIPVNNATDCWGNKYTYIVTEDLVDPLKFLDNTTDGKLFIKTAGGDMFLDGAGYALISHGEDQLGAVKGNYAGMDKKWCTSSAELRTENCDIDDTDLVAAEFNNGKDATTAYYDDLILYRGKPWRNSGSSPYPPAPVAGVCHPNDGARCSSGTPATITPNIDGTLTWECIGENGGATTNCSGYWASCPYPNGSFGDCHTGNPSGINDPVCYSTGQSVYLWTCHCAGMPCLGPASCTTDPMPNMSCP